MRRIHTLLPLLFILALTGCGEDAEPSSSDASESMGAEGGDAQDNTDDGMSNDGGAQPDFDCPDTLPSSEVLYESRFQEVFGAQMHYYESGPADGPVVLLLHGLPVSAYFWRNVMPHIESSSRVIALDHIGFGKSDRPAGIGFGLEDQVRYLDGFVRALALEDMVVVGQDLGSWVGMTWASRNPEMVRAVALVEGIIPPLLPASASTTDPNLLGIWLAARDPEQAQQMFVEEHFFINAVLPGFTACGLSPEAMAVYAEPWADPESRHILYATPAEIPIDGQPAAHVESVAAYVEWIESTDIPKLLVHATPGALMSAPIVEAAKERMSNVTTSSVGGGIHFLAESKPDEVGEALASWLDTLP